MSRPKHGTLARAAQHHDEADRTCIDCAEVERDYAFEQWKFEREIATERLHDRDRWKAIAEAHEDSWHNAEAGRHAAAQMAGAAGDRLGEARADRNRARNIAVHLEQENAQLTADYAEAVDEIAGILPQVRELEAEYERARQTAVAAASVIEQVGLLVEHCTWGDVPPRMLQRILDGATFEEVRDA